jgi:DNA polymerase (family 10)
MPVYNSDVAEMFSKVADLLEIEGANQYRVRAYRTAARTIQTLSHSVADLVEQGEDLTELEGIGEDLAEKTEEIVKTGSLKLLEEIEQRTPPELAEMLRISGLGPKRVHTLQGTGHHFTERTRRGSEARQGPRIGGAWAKDGAEDHRGLDARAGGTKAHSNRRGG